MATYTVTETRPNTSISFISDDSRYSGMAEDLTNDLTAAGIVTTMETSPDGLVRTYTRTMTEDKILVFKEIYEGFNLELGTLKIANNDQGWGLLIDGFDPSTSVVVTRGFYNTRDQQIYTGEIVV